MITRNYTFYYDQYKKMQIQEGLKFMNGCLRHPYDANEKDWAERAFEAAYGKKPGDAFENGESGGQKAGATNVQTVPIAHNPQAVLENSAVNITPDYGKEIDILKQKMDLILTHLSKEDGSDDNNKSGKKKGTVGKKEITVPMDSPDDSKKGAGRPSKEK